MTADRPQVVSVIAPSVEATRDSAARPPAGSVGLIAVAGLGIAVVLPLAASTSFDVPSWTLRWALLPAIAGGGLAALVAVATRPGAARTAARWALGWLAWAAFATLLAPSPATAVWGEYQVGTGLIFLLALGGAWAIGTRTGQEGSRLIASALLAGCTINAVLAVAEQVVDLRAFGVEVFAGRSAGLYGNPVYLAELLAGGLWLAISRLARSDSSSARGRWGPAAAAIVIAAGIELSGSRAALLLALAAAVVAAVSARGRWRVCVLAVVGAGIAVGAFVGAVAPGSTTSTDRVTGVAEATDGYQPRVATWEAGIGALGPRVLWGFGPSGVLAATGTRRTLAVATSEGPDTMFADAHDFVVESAVTTGFVGLALLAIWLFGAVGLARRTRPRQWGYGLLGFAGMVAGVSLVEPLHVGVTPLALLALGAAGSARASAPDEPAGAAVSAGTASHLHDAGSRRPTLLAVLAAALAVSGAALSVWLLVGVTQLHQADLDGNPRAARAAADRLPPVGEPDAIVGLLYGFQGITGSPPGGLHATVVWWTKAAGQDPDNPARWSDLAGVLDATGDPVGAAADYRRALADNPWSERALTALIHIGVRGGVTGAEQQADTARLALLRPAPTAPSAVK